MQKKNKEENKIILPTSLHRLQMFTPYILTQQEYRMHPKDEQKRSG